MKLSAFLILILYIIGISTKKFKKFQRKCQRFCTINYYPVCASNGTCMSEFKNICKMDNHNCDLKKNNMTEFKPIRVALCFNPDNPCHTNTTCCDLPKSYG